MELSVTSRQQQEDLFCFLMVHVINQTYSLYLQPRSGEIGTEENMD